MTTKKIIKKKFIPIPMTTKELQEARRLGIPSEIISKLSLGVEPSESEKQIIKTYGKEYVGAHERGGKWIKPHLRDYKTSGKRYNFNINEWIAQKRGSKTMVITGFKEKETKKAYLINVNGDKIWLPKSQVIEITEA